MLTIKDNYIYSMSKDNSPAFTAESKAILRFETKDCYAGQIKSEDGLPENYDSHLVNPATGPVYIKGSAAGDILKVSVLDIETAESGLMTISPFSSIFGDRIKKRKIKLIDVKEGFAYFTEKIKIPVNPMIGVIGVAPKTGSISCSEPGSHGGNMDNRRITKGSVLYLPVFHDGALFSLGDVHASMGDGEICGTGIEIPAAVTLKIEVIKGHSIKNPMLEDDNYFYTLASEDTLDEAIKTASEDMAEILKEKSDIDFDDAVMLLSAAGDVKICQLVDPKITATVAFPKNLL